MHQRGLGAHHSLDLCDLVTHAGGGVGSEVHQDGENHGGEERHREVDTQRRHVGL